MSLYKNIIKIWISIKRISLCYVNHNVYPHTATISMVEPAIVVVCDVHYDYAIVVVCDVHYD